MRRLFVAATVCAAPILLPAAAAFAAPPGHAGDGHHSATVKAGSAPVSIDDLAGARARFAPLAARLGTASATVNGTVTDSYGTAVSGAAMEWSAGQAKASGIGAKARPQPTARTPCRRCRPPTARSTPTTRAAPRRSFTRRTVGRRRPRRPSTSSPAVCSRAPRCGGPWARTSSTSTYACGGPTATPRSRRPPTAPPPPGRHRRQAGRVLLGQRQVLLRRGRGVRSRPSPSPPARRPAPR